jgi:hypothetical protein
MSDKIIERIKKLLSLSKSSNEHEAALAAGRAADLMLKHEIQEAQLADSPSEGVDLMEMDKSGQVVHWKGNLMGGLADGLGCAFHYHRRRVAPGSRKTFISYMIVGQPSKVATIQYMYSYLTAEVTRLADAAYGQEHQECAASDVPPPSSRSWKNAFRLGAARTIAKRLRAQRKETHDAARLSGHSNALVVVEAASKAVQEYVAAEVGPLSRGSQAAHSSRSGYQAGASAGAAVGLGGSGAKLGSGTKRLGA